MTTLKEKKQFKMPHVFVIMFIIMLLVTLLTYVIPSGEYQRVVTEGGTSMVDPDTFQYVEKDTPVTFLDFFRSIYNGFVQGATIMGSLLLCSGALGILNHSGSLAAGIQKLISVSKGKEMITVVVFYTFFAILNIKGSGEGSYPFFPIVIGMVMSLGYDRVLGAGAIMFGCTAGFACGMLNMFTTGISQEMVGLPLFSGIGYRTVVFAVLYAIGLIALFAYARKIKKDPNKSYVAEEYKAQLAKASASEVDEGEQLEFNAKRKLGLVIFLCTLIIQVVGALNYGWGLAEISSLYIIFSIVLAVIFRINPSDYSKLFIKGASTVLGAALVIGLARSVMIILTQGKIMDSIVHYMASALDGKSPMITLLLLYLFVTAFNFLVVSGSGKAVIMVPIMSPLGQMLGINQQVMILTYQLGDGLTNNLWPGGGAVGCALCGLDYTVWFKYSWKIFALMIAAGYGLIVIADLINYGPF